MLYKVSSLNLFYTPKQGYWASTFQFSIAHTKILLCTCLIGVQCIHVV